MSSWDLADWQGEFSQYASGRILGIGAHQYDGAGSQKFEGLTVEELCDELVDELADVVNYAAMLAAKVMWLRREAGMLERRPF